MVPRVEHAVFISVVTDVIPFFDNGHYHVCNFKTAKMKASLYSPVGAGIKATLPACLTQSNSP